MKGIVVYYSATGNTKKIAHAIHAGMRQAMECHIAPLKEVIPRDLIEYDLIGLGSPVWGATRVPKHVLAFINSTPSLEGKHGFPFYTHGTLPGGYMQRILPALKRKGLTIIGFGDWYGSVLLPDLPHPWFTDGHPDDIDLKEAEDFGRKMAESSQKILLGETRLIPGLPRGREWHELYGQPSKTPHDAIEARQEAQKRMKINMGKCTHPGCSLCVDHCPMNSIDFSVSPPVFRRNCARCWICEQICPSGAIEVDWESVFRVNRKYIKSHYGESIDELESKGRFRRLVTSEDIGWDTPWYKVSGHPRYKIE